MANVNPVRIQSTFEVALCRSLVSSIPDRIWCSATSRADGMTDDEKLNWIAVRLAAVAFVSGKHINAPTEEGRELGSHLARWADQELAKRKAVFPNHVERCATCAFRRGTVANQSPATLLSALECLQGDDIFMCHERVDHDCVGYSVLKN